LSNNNQYPVRRAEEANMYDVLIKGGTVVDGSGAPARTADVAIRDGRIVAVGKVEGGARREIDADGLLVTPGFVDIHTHYDAQALWDSHMKPSSAHGVTSVVMGNCGVGFAPCRPGDRDALVQLMEGVEDIPGAVMAEGLPWDWESFPDFLDRLDARPRDIDVAAFLPHSPLRVYAMGERGLQREAATERDLEQMAQLTREAVAAGAIGFATSRLSAHRSADGSHIPTFHAAERELTAIARAVAEGGGGTLQGVSDAVTAESAMADLRLFEEMARASGCPLTFTLAQTSRDPDHWREILAHVGRVNADGLNVKAQVLPRPVGIILGLDLTAHAFSLCPSYMAIAHLPLAEKVAIMRRPDFRAKLLAEQPVDPKQPLAGMGRNLGNIFALGDPPNYEPDRNDSVAAEAARRGLDPLAFVYDLLLEKEGRNLLFLPVAGFAEGNLDAVHAMLSDANVLPGLGDGGAHYGLVCDSTYTTFALTHWVRDRNGARFPLERMVKGMTQDTARMVGMKDRGLLVPGLRADINLIDFDHLRLHMPEVVRDLPGGGRRLSQSAEGYVETLVNGVSTWRDGDATGELPGRLVRGGRARAAA
jgi:N-acyl-D-aspartate/D-glutamate deacylase